MKITDLNVVRYRTLHKRDINGDRLIKRVEYIANRPVKVINGVTRFFHFIIDYFIIQVIIYNINYIFSLLLTSEQYDSLLTSIGALWINVIFMLIYILYYIIAEQLWQTTPGKFITSSIVIDSKGQKPDLKTNILRNIIRLVPFEVLSCLSDRGWHDIWSGTYVISKKEYHEIQQLLDEQNEEEGLNFDGES